MMTRALSPSLGHVKQWNYWWQWWRWENLPGLQSSSDSHSAFMPLLCPWLSPARFNLRFKPTSCLRYKKWLVTKHSNLIYHNMQNWTNAFTLKFYCLWFPLRKSSRGKYLGIIRKGRGWFQPSSSVYYPPAQQSESLSHKWLKENSFREGIIKKNCS